MISFPMAGAVYTAVPSINEEVGYKQFHVSNLAWLYNLVQLPIASICNLWLLNVGEPVWCVCVCVLHLAYVRWWGTGLCDVWHFPEVLTGWDRMKLSLLCCSCPKLWFSDACILNLPQSVTLTLRRTILLMKFAFMWTWSHRTSSIWRALARESTGLKAKAVGADLIRSMWPREEKGLAATLHLLTLFWSACSVT